MPGAAAGTWAAGAVTGGSPTPGAMAGSIAPTPLGRMTMSGASAPPGLGGMLDTGLPAQERARGGCGSDRDLCWDAGALSAACRLCRHASRARRAALTAAHANVTFACRAPALGCHANGT
jgi:hypothetical protein